MNPSYENGGPGGASGIPGAGGSGALGAGASGMGGISGADGLNTPGVKPGAIVSGPDDVTAPAPTPAVSLPDTPSGGLRGGLFRRPTGGRPDAAVMISDTGGGQKRSNRGLIIAGGILVVAAIVLGVVAVMLNRNGGSTENNNGSAVEIINMPSFNQLINYAISGEETDNAVMTGYNVNSEYYLLNVTGDEKKSAYKKMGELMKAFVSDYNSQYSERSEENDRNQRLKVLVESTADLFDFVNVMEFTDKIYGYQIREMGETGALAYYNFPKSMSNNDYVTGFIEAYQEWVEAVLGDMEETEAAYQTVASYYDMATDFVASLYGINGMMRGQMMGGVSE